MVSCSLCDKAFDKDKKVSFAAGLEKGVEGNVSGGIEELLKVELTPLKGGRSQTR